LQPLSKEMLLSVSIKVMKIKVMKMEKEFGYEMKRLNFVVRIEKKLVVLKQWGFEGILSKNIRRIN